MCWKFGGTTSDILKTSLFYLKETGGQFPFYEMIFVGEKLQSWTGHLFVLLRADPGVGVGNPGKSAVRLVLLGQVFLLKLILCHFYDKGF